MFFAVFLQHCFLSFNNNSVYFRWTDPSSDHQLCRTGAVVASSQRRNSNDNSRLSDPLRKQCCFWYEKSSSSGARKSGHGKKGVVDACVLILKRVFLHNDIKIWVHLFLSTWQLALSCLKALRESGLFRYKVGMIIGLKQFLIPSHRICGFQWFVEF